MSRLLNYKIFLIGILFAILFSSLAAASEPEIPDNFIIIENRMIDFEYWMSLDQTERDALVTRIMNELAAEGHTGVAAVYWRLNPGESLEDLRQNLRELSEEEGNEVISKVIAIIPQAPVALTAVKVESINEITAYFSANIEDEEGIDESYFTVKVGDTEIDVINVTKNGRIATLAVDPASFKQPLAGMLEVNGIISNAMAVSSAGQLDGAIEDSAVAFIYLTPGEYHGGITLPEQEVSIFRVINRTYADGILEEATVEVADNYAVAIAIAVDNISEVFIAPGNYTLAITFTINKGKDLKADEEVVINFTIGQTSIETLTLGDNVFIGLNAIDIAGEALVGEILEAVDLDPSFATVGYQWQRADAADGTYANIAGATGSSYQLTEADRTKWIRVQVTGTGDFTGTVASEPVEVLAPETYLMVDEDSSDLDKLIGLKADDTMGEIGLSIFVKTENGNKAYNASANLVIEDPSGEQVFNETVEIGDIEAGEYKTATFDLSELEVVAGIYKAIVTLDADNQEARTLDAWEVAVREYVSMSVSADVPTFKVGEQQEYTVSTVANDDAGRMVRAYFNIPDSATVEYYEVQDGNWYALGNEYGPQDGFPVADATSKFRAVFSEAGTYTVTVEFKEVGTNDVLATYELEATVEADPVQEALEQLVAELEMDVSYVANGMEAKFDQDSIEVPDVLSGYKIDVLVELDEALPEDARVTILYNGDPTLADEAEVDGTEIWLSDLVLGGNPADFVSGDVATWTVLISGNEDDITVKGTIKSIVSKDGFDKEKVVLAEADFEFEAKDSVAPEFEGVDPERDTEVELAHDESFVWKVKASDKNLYELEIDHNMEGTLPEFSVYADADNPYGDSAADFAAAGVEVEYNATDQEWTIDFGEAVTKVLAEKGDIKFYIVLADEAGNEWGSMYNVTDENTFAYNIIKLPAPDIVPPEVVALTHDPETKTVVYQFDEPIKLKGEEGQGDIAAEDVGDNIIEALLDIYDVRIHLGEIEYEFNNRIQSVEWDAATYTMTIVYTGDLPVGIYVVDTWGYHICDLAGNEIELSDDVTFTVAAPPVELALTEPVDHDADAKTIVYTFNEEFKLVREFDNPWEIKASDLKTENAGLFQIFLLGEDYSYDYPGSERGTVTYVKWNEADNTLTITYDGELPAGTYLVDTWGYTITSLDDVAIDAEANFNNAVFTVELTKVMVDNKADLEAALADEDIEEITVNGEIEGNFTIDRGITLKGTDKGVLSNDTSVGAPLLEVTAENVVIGGLTFAADATGASFNNQTIGVNINSSNVTVKNSTFNITGNKSAIGLQSGKTINNIVINNNTINGSEALKSAAIALNANGEGIEVTNNTVNRGAIGSGPLTWETAEDIKITGNNITESNTEGIFLIVNEASQDQAKTIANKLNEENTVTDPGTTNVLVVCSEGNVYVPGVFNGSVSGVINTENGVVTGSLTGDFNVTISGTVTGYIDNRATFTGIVTGDIVGDIEAAINANGIDTLSGTVTGTGAVKPVRVIGIFPQSGTTGEFEGQVITGPLPTYVESMSIKTPNDVSTVTVGETLQMTVEVSPEDASEEVIWSVWAKEDQSTDIATIDQDTGLLTGVKPGEVTVIAKALDGSLADVTYIVTVEAAQPVVDFEISGFDELTTGDNEVSITVKAEKDAIAEEQLVRYRLTLTDGAGNPVSGVTAVDGVYKVKVVTDAEGVAYFGAEAHTPEGEYLIEDETMAGFPFGNIKAAAEGGGHVSDFIVGNLPAGEGYTLVIEMVAWDRSIGAAGDVFGRETARFAVEEEAPVINATRNIGYDTIQAAIAAANDGDIISVSPGMFAEQLDIRTEIVLVGAGEGTVIIPPATLAAKFKYNSRDWQPIVYVHGCNAEISNLVIDGQQKGYNYFAGLVFHNAGGKVENVTVRNIRDESLSQSKLGVGLLGFNADEGERQIVISESQFEDYQKGGMIISGTGLFAKINNNRVQGTGPTNRINMNGIQVSNGAAAVISENIVYGHKYSSPIASGIYIVGASSVVVNNNTVYHNDRNIYLKDTLEYECSGNVDANNDPVEPVVEP